MLNIFSILLGLLALLLAIPAFIPLLGWANWFILIIAFGGLGLGLLSSKTSGRNFNLFVIVVCVVRLWLGGGIF